jgi:alpha-tubulin suppressor-like RCC1 family protein
MFDLYQKRLWFDLVDEQHTFHLHPPTITKSICIEKDEQILIVSVCSSDRLVLHWISHSEPVRQSDYEASESLNDSDPHLSSPQSALSAANLSVSLAQNDVVDVALTSCKEDLLVLTSTGRLLAIPVFRIVALRVKSSKLYEDGRVISDAIADSSSALCSYYSHENGQEIAIVGAKSGQIRLIAMKSGMVLTSTTIDRPIVSLNVLIDQQAIALVITASDSKQWRFVLEKRRNALTFRSTADNRIDLGAIDAAEETGDEPFEDADRLRLFQCLNSNDSGDADQFNDKPTLLLPSNFMFSFLPNKPIAQNDHDRYLLIQQEPFIFMFAFSTSDSFVNLSVFELNNFRYPTFTPLARYALPSDCLDEQRPRIALTDRFILSARQNVLYLISRQHSDYRRISHDNQIVSQLSFDREIVHFFAFQKGANKVTAESRTKDESRSSATKSQDESFELEPLLIITRQHLYECSGNVSCADLFLQILKQTLTNEKTTNDNCLAKAEQFLFSLKLPSNVFFERAALHFLKERDFDKAFRLFAAAGTRTLNRLLHCIRLGQIGEAINCIEQTLNERSTQLDLVERSQLSSLLIECLVERNLEKHLTHEKQNLTNRIQRWLSNDLWYNGGSCVKLFVRVAMFDLAEIVAVARQEHVTFLKSLLSICGHSLNEQDALQQDVIWRCALHPNVVNAFIELPSLINKYLHTLIDHLPRFSNSLLQLASATFDPRRPNVRLLLQLIPQIQRQYLRFDWKASSKDLDSMFDSDDASLLNRRDLLNFFFFVVFLLHRNRKTISFETELFQLSDEIHLASVRSQRAEPQDHRWWHKHFPTKNWLCAGSKRSFFWIDRQLFAFGPSFSVTEHCSYVKNFKPIFSESNTIQVLSMSAGASHAVLITDHGCFAFGRSKYGQLGCGPQLRYANVPLLIESLPVKGVRQVSCGQYHTLALHENGTLFSWGWAVHGQLGHGSVENEPWPRQVKHFDRTPIESISAGYCHSIVLDRDGIVYSFGSGMFGQLGHGNGQKSTYPQPLIKIQEPIVSISSRFFQTVAIASGGKRLYTWGCSPQTVQLKAQCVRRERLHRASIMVKDGSGDIQPESTVHRKADTSHLSIRTIDLKDLDGNVIKCDTGALHSLLLTDQGRVYSWGRGPDGQMGHDCKKELVKPTMISKLLQHNVVDISAGLDYSLALTDKNELFVWGSNSCGQLGLQQSTVAPKASTSLNSFAVLPTPSATSGPTGSAGKIVNKINRRLINYMRDSQIEPFPVQVHLSFNDTRSNLLDSESTENSFESQADDVPDPIHCASMLDSFESAENESMDIDHNWNVVRFSIEELHIARLIRRYRRELDLQLLLTSALNCCNYQIAAFICEITKKPLLALKYYFKALLQLKNDDVAQPKQQFDRAIKALLLHYLKTNSSNRAFGISLHEIMFHVLSEWKTYDLDVIVLEDVLLQVYEQEPNNFMFGICLFKLFDQPQLPHFRSDFKLKCVQLTLRHIQQSNLSSLMSDPVLELLAPNPNSSNISSSFADDQFGASSTEQTWKNVLRNIQNAVASNCTSRNVTNTIGVPQPIRPEALSISLGGEPNETNDSRQNMKPSWANDSICIDPSEPEVYVFSCKHQYGKNFFEKVLVRQLKQLNVTNDRSSGTNERIEKTDVREYGNSTLIQIWLQRYESKNHDPFVVSKCPLCVLADNL